MVFNALQINGYVFSEEIGASAKKVRSVDTGICGVRTQRRSHHWPSSGDVWVRACYVKFLASSVPQLQHERGIAH